MEVMDQGQEKYTAASGTQLLRFAVTFGGEDGISGYKKNIYHDNQILAKRVVGNW
jgi:hypothetical protein